MTFPTARLRTDVSCSPCASASHALLVLPTSLLALPLTGSQYDHRHRSRSLSFMLSFARALALSLMRAHTCVPAKAHPSPRRCAVHLCARLWVRELLHFASVVYRGGTSRNVGATHTTSCLLRACTWGLPGHMAESTRADPPLPLLPWPSPAAALLPPKREMHRNLLPSLSYTRTSHCLIWQKIAISMAPPHCP